MKIRYAGQVFEIGRRGYGATRSVCVWLGPVPLAYADAGWLARLGLRELVFVAFARACRLGLTT